MNASHRHALRRRLAPVATLALTASALTGAGLAADSAAAQTRTAPVTLVTPVAQQTIERDKGEPAYLYDLGMYLVAPKSTVEIRTSRPSYKKPITATLSIGDGAGKTTTALPAGLIQNADQLKNFLWVTVTNSAGKTVKNSLMSFCPDSYEAARAVRDGAPTSPYPQQCGDNPFAKGYVFGIQRGWSVPVLNDWEEPPSFTGKDGVYQVKLLINKPWRDALKMTKSQATGSIKVKLTTDSASQQAGAPAATAMATMPGMEHMSMAPAGQLSPQRAILETARLRALGKPNQPAAGRPRASVRGSAMAGPMPDLRALPAWQIALDNNDANGNPSKKTYLDFGATVWNAGPSPMVVDGFRRPGSTLMDAYQYFFDSHGKQVGSAPAGTLQWDGRKGHNHWHFTSFATYRLLDSTQKVALRSGKEAFCLAPTDGIDLTVPDANWLPASTDLSTACGQGDQGALSIREVLDVGWGDTYSQSLPGQSFDVTKVPNGIYYIEVVANPDHVLSETSTANNRALRKVKLGGTVGGKRTIHVYDYLGIKAP